MKVINLINVTIRTVRGTEADGSFISYRSRGQEFNLNLSPSDSFGIDAEDEGTIDAVDNVYVKNYTRTSAITIPDPQPDTVYIVPKGVAMYFPRTDLLFPVDHIDDGTSGKDTNTYRFLGRVKE